MTKVIDKKVSTGGSVISPEKQAELDAAQKKAKEKYGDNHWWESDDLLTLAYYQMHEDILLIPFSKFHEAVEHAVDSPVWTHQFATMRNELTAAIDKAWENRRQQ